MEAAHSLVLQVPHVLMQSLSTIRPEIGGNFASLSQSLKFIDVVPVVLGLKP